jgi:hypothetical protein
MRWILSDLPDCFQMIRERKPKTIFRMLSPRARFARRFRFRQIKSGWRKPQEHQPLTEF